MKKRSFNILLADDDRAIGTVVSAILQRRGDAVEWVKNGNEAIKLITIKPNHYDVLITDYNMPLVTGLELIHYVRKTGPEIKIIVISASMTDELMLAYESKGVDKILQKPFMLENLASALDGILEQWMGGCVVN